MDRIQIKEDFIIDGQKTKIISGAVHYFRIVPEYWEDTLLDLKDMGCNAVETYVPWNLHEPYKGKFDFDGQKDVCAFLELAKKLGLYVIVRPSPYICSEWELGGLPAWLLKDSDIRLRTNDSVYMKHLEEYYAVLLPMIAKYQINREGTIILAQLENEYGSYNQDKDYLKALLKIMREYGIEVPIFTADGTWEEALEAGSLFGEGVFPTGNFGSNAKENIAVLKEFMKKHQIVAPIMCMEFWDGWFNRWNMEIVKRDPKELVQSAKEMIDLGSINFYMFHGGTNFGWMNGCSARKEHDLPQITSYDYDAILTEYGAKTEKYHLLRKMITGKQDILPDRRKTASYGRVSLNRSVSLFNTLSSLSSVIESPWPESFEKLDYYYGYVLYEHDFESYKDDVTMRIIDARDRAQIYLDKEYVATQYQEEIGDPVTLHTKKDCKHSLGILLENMGRVNYGSKLQADTQRKGIRNGVMLDIHFTKNWKQYCIDFTKVNQIEWDNANIGGPTFNEYVFDIQDTPKETFIDLSAFGKGIVIVNGFNLGRFYNSGPTLSLYIPGPLLKKGNNQIVIFETEGIVSDSINLVDKPIFKKDMNNN